MKETCGACKAPLATVRYRCRCGQPFCHEPQVSTYMDHDKGQVVEHRFFCHELHHCTLRLEAATQRLVEIHSRRIA